jgi:hypothetical protein
VSHFPVGRVLWFDDEPVNDILERDAFARAGIACDSYTNNNDGLKALSIMHYDLVVSDIDRDIPQNRMDLTSSGQYATRSTVLQHIERRLALRIECNHFAINDRFISKRTHRSGNGRITRREVPIVARSEACLRAALYAKSSVSIELELFCGVRRYVAPAC